MTIFRDAFRYEMEKLAATPQMRPSWIPKQTPTPNQPSAPPAPQNSAEKAPMPNTTDGINRNIYGQMKPQWQRQRQTQNAEYINPSQQRPMPTALQQYGQDWTSYMRR